MYCVLYIDKTITNGDKEKKDMKKRLFSGFLALMMVFTLVNPMSFTARADENTVEETQVQSDESTVEETQVQSDESTVEETQVQSDESTVGETQVQSDESTVEETQVQSGESTVGETQVQSDDSTVDGIFKNVQAEEVSGTPRLDAISGNIGNSAEDRPVSYRDDEMVTIIVELEEAPLMDAYVMNPYTVRDDETAGEAVAEFLASDAAMQAADELRSEQQALFNEIQAMQPAVMSTEEDETLSLVTLTAQWTVLVNGMAVKAPYGMLAGIRELDGVKRAYVEHTYDEPKEPVTELSQATAMIWFILARHGRQAIQARDFSLQFLTQVLISRVQHGLMMRRMRMYSEYVVCMRHSATIHLSQTLRTVNSVIRRSHS